MTNEQIVQSIAYCGLICFLCRPDEACHCLGNNHCGKRLGPGGCFQYSCCSAKKLRGCWECPDAPCGQDMLAEHMLKTRAFITCMKEDGTERFASYIARNAEHGIVYHRDGIRGDYDLASEEAILQLLRTGGV